MNVICGINAVMEALAAGTRSFDRLMVVKGTRNKRVSDVIASASQLGIPLRFESRETLDRVAGEVPHQGVIALVSAKPVIGLDELVAGARDPGLLVALDGIEDPRNLGAILRTIDASGAHGVILPERHSAGLSETVARTSAGGLEHVKVARVGNLVQALEAVKARGYWTVGFDASGTERWDAIDYKRNVVLVLGGEDRGIRRLVREHCDHLVSLPMFGHVNSLNVSVAAGIALYEVVRQRGNVPSHVRPIPARGKHDVEGARSSAWHTHDAPAPQGDEGEEEANNVFLPEEDVTWPQAPVMLPDRERRRRKQERMRDRTAGRGEGQGHGQERDRGRKRKKRPGGRPDAPGTAGSPVPDGAPRPEGGEVQVRARGPEDRGEGSAPGDRSDRLRRRRKGRHRRPGGGGPGGGEPRPAGDRPAPQGPGPDRGASGPANGGERGPGGPPRLRRRRRRGRGGPGGAGGPGGPPPAA